MSSQQRDPAAGPLAPAEREAALRAASRGEQALVAVLDELDESDVRALIRVAAAAGSAHHVEDVLEVAAEQTAKALDAASVSISRWEREHAVLRTLINVGDLGPGEERWPDDETYPLADYPLLIGLLQRGEPYVTHHADPDADPRAVELLEELNKGAEVAAPIWFEGRLWGELWATTPREAPAPTQTQVRLCLALADQVAVAIGRAELFDRVAALASRDPLTGLANRRALDADLEARLAEAGDLDRPLTVVVCDIDHFKAINDELGHDAGDETLRRVADALSTTASEFTPALVGRLGGDEFCVVLDGCDHAGGQEYARRVMERLGGDASTREVGCSFGVATRGPGAQARRDLLRMADRALYAAKRGGRGRVASAPDRGSVDAALQEAMAVVEQLFADDRTRELTDELSRLRGLLEALDARLTRG